MLLVSILTKSQLWLVEVYHHVISGGRQDLPLQVASSAPIHFDGVEGFFRLVTEAADSVAPGCAQRVRHGFAQLLGDRSAAGRSIRDIFGLCGDDGVERVILWARNAFVTAPGRNAFENDC